MISSFIAFFRDILLFFPSALRGIFVAFVTLAVVSFIFHLIKMAWGLIGK